jgi:hypothetical protein
MKIEEQEPLILSTIKINSIHYDTEKKEWETKSVGKVYKGLDKYHNKRSIFQAKVQGYIIASIANNLEFMKINDDQIDVNYEMIQTISMVNLLKSDGIT